MSRSSKKTPYIAPELLKRVEAMNESGAKEVLKTMIRDIKFGLVPNGYSGYDNRPLYNSVDASLLLFEAVQKYINYTGDYQFIKEEIYRKLYKRNRCR